MIKMASNTKHLGVLYSLLVSVFLVWSVDLISQTSGNIRQLLEQLQSKDWKSRSQAYQELRRYSNEEEVKVALMRAFEIEIAEEEQWWAKHRKNNMHQDKPAVEEDDGRGEYYLDLLKTIESTNDPRAIKLLVIGAAISYDSRRIVAAQGSKSIPFLLDALNKSNNPSVLVAVPETICIMAEMGKMTESERLRLEKVLIEQIKVADDAARLSCVKALGAIGNKEALNTLNTIVMSDKCVIKRKGSKGSMIEYYPIRDEAKNAILKIKAGDKAGHN